MAVFESTAAEHGGLARPRLPEISVISPGLDPRPCFAEPVRVVVCLYPMTFSLLKLLTCHISHQNASYPNDQTEHVNICNTFNQVL